MLFRLYCNRVVKHIIYALFARGKCLTSGRNAFIIKGTCNVCFYQARPRLFRRASRPIQRQTSHVLPKIHKSQIRQGTDRSAQKVQISPCSIWRVIWKNLSRNAATVLRVRITPRPHPAAVPRIPAPPCRPPLRALQPPLPSRPAAALRARPRTRLPKPPPRPRSSPRHPVRAAMRSRPTASPVPRARAVSSACPSIWK